MKIANQHTALEEGHGFNPENNTLSGQPFIGEVNDWGQKYQEHLQGPNKEISFYPKSGIEKRECGSCFYRHGNSSRDCQMVGNGAKKRFGIPIDTFMPTSIDGKDVGHFCPNYLNADAE